MLPAAVPPELTWTFQESGLHLSWDTERPDISEFKLFQSLNLKDWTQLQDAVSGSEYSVNPKQPAAFFRLERNLQEQQPNIIFIYTDDQAPWALGKSGYPYARTPNIDRIFEEGAYLKNAFTTTPVCSPSRASMLTSRYGSELGITEWINPSTEPRLGLSSQFPAWPALLRDSGYRTALVGKWHLGLVSSSRPERFGYEKFSGFLGGGTSPENPTLEIDGETRVRSGYTPDLLTDQAIRFMKEFTSGPESGSEPLKPFCISLHFRAPHTAWLPVRPEDWAPFSRLNPDVPNPDYPNLDIERVKRMTREYLASVASVDRNVGRVLSELELLGIEDDTIVIFTSDHGYNMGHNGIWHKGNGHWVLTRNPPPTPNIPGGQRPNMYDHSIRVPTGIRWPGRIRPGTEITETFSNLDWFPTLLSMARVELPKSETIRGRDMTPLLLGNGEVGENRGQDFFAQYSTRHQSRTHMRMVREPEWKLVRDFLNPERDELYHLAEDPEESVNRIHEESVFIQNQVQRLHQKLLTHMQSINDPLYEELTQPAQWESAKVIGAGPRIQLVFSRSIDQQAASNESVFVIYPDVSVLEATVSESGETVILTTSGLMAGEEYTLTLRGLKDGMGYELPEQERIIQAASPEPGYAWVKYFDGVSSPSLGALRSHPDYPETPGEAGLVDRMETETNRSDQYGAQLTAVLIPDATDDYVFYVSSDDVGELWLSSDESESGLRLIATDPSWHRPRDWVLTDRRQVVDQGTDLERLQNESRPIRLEAGGRYLIRALMVDGGGGDNLGVAWRKSADAPLSNGDAPIGGEFLEAWIP